MNMIEKVKWALLLESQVSQFYLLLLNFGHKSESMINDHQTNLNILVYKKVDSIT